MRGIQGSVFLGSEIRWPLAHLTELSRMLGARLGATAEGVGDPVGDRRESQGKSAARDRFPP